MTQSSPHRITALIAAGGVGSRFGSGKHKQCLMLKGKPLYMWSVLAFLSNKRITNAVIVSHAEIKSEIEEELDRHLTHRRKDVQVITGGDTRQESVLRGLRHLAEGAVKPDFVLVHDAARPFVKQNLIDATIESVIKYGACTVAVAVSDTIKKVDNGSIVETIDRSTLYAVHTPQGGRFDWLLEGHEDAVKKNVAATDDAFILERCHHEVKIVEGDKYNIKVTVPDDLEICEALSGMFVSQIMDV